MPPYFAPLVWNTNQEKGEGDLTLRGNKDGDIFFHNRAGHKIHPPLISNTIWNFSRIDRILWDRGYALGKFRLRTKIDTGSLRKFGININFSTIARMGHRDIMFKPGGIDAANETYYGRLFRRIVQEHGIDFLMPDKKSSETTAEEVPQ